MNDAGVRGAFIQNFSPAEAVREVQGLRASFPEVQSQTPYARIASVRRTSSIVMCRPFLPVPTDFSPVGGALRAGLVASGISPLWLTGPLPTKEEKPTVLTAKNKSRRLAGLSPPACEEVGGGFLQTRRPLSLCPTLRNGS